MKYFHFCATLFLAVLVGMSLRAQTQDDYITAMQTENWSRAVAIEQKAAETMPSDLNPWFNLSAAAQAAGMTETSRKALKHILGLSPDALYEHLAQGRLALIDGKTQEATEHFRQAAKKGRKVPDALHLIGVSYLFGEHRNLKEAETWLKKAYDFRSKHFPTLMDLGYCYIQLNDGGAALVYYEAAARVRPELVLPVYMSAKTYQRAKIHTRYVEMLDKALTIDSLFQPALRDKAEYFYFKARDFNQAVVAYETLLQRHPDVPVDDKMLYVNSLFLSRNYPKTIEWVDKIILEDGSKNYLRRLSAYANYESGNYEKGLAIMEDYFGKVTADKIIPQDYEYFGKLLQKNGRDSLAAIQYQLAIVADSSRWELYNDIGQIQYGQGNYKEAVESYRKRLDSVPEPGVMDFYRIGIAWYAQNDSTAYEEAARLFEKVSERAPDAAVGWLMQAKSLAKLEPDLEQHPELASRFGRAQTAFENYVAIANSDPEKNRKDLIAAYEYLVYFHYVKENEEAARPVIASLLALEPGNATALEVNKLLDDPSGQNK